MKLYQLLTILFLSLFLGCNSFKGDIKPNIVIFFTDDQGYADVGCYGAEGFETPHIDALAKDGVQFTDFYVPATVCTPSRAGLLTGRYPVRAGLHEGVISPYSDHGMLPEEYTMAEMLKEAGYSTACVGKWHLGHKPEFMPNNQGFDFYYGVPYSNDMDRHYYAHNKFQSPPLPVYRNTILEEEGPEQKYLTKMFTTEAINFINEKKEEPFFLYLAHCMPHVPLHASEDFKGKSELGLYGDVIMELDWSMGEIIRTLKEQGIYENTIIVFTSDNGAHKGSNKPLRGHKATTWEGGQRVPGIVSWPGNIQANKTCSELVTVMDLFPTFANLTGVVLEPDFKLDGQDIQQLLKNPEQTSLDERPFMYYSRDGEIEAVRKGQWKLHIAKRRGWDSKESFPISLYNLSSDVRERVNVASDHPEVVAELTGIIHDFEKSIY